jgi:hypothetical protein
MKILKIILLAIIAFILTLLDIFSYIFVLPYIICRFFLALMKRNSLKVLMSITKAYSSLIE